MVGEKDQLYRALSDTLDEGLAAVGPDTLAGRRIAETRDFFNYLSKELPLLVERWRRSGSRQTL